MTAAAYNATHPFAVPVEVASGRKAGATSHVLCHQPKSFDWRVRGGKPHALRRVDNAAFAQVLLVLNQIIQL